MNDEMKSVMGDGRSITDQRQKEMERRKNGTEITLLILFTSESFFSVVVFFAFHFVFCTMKEKTRFLPTRHSFIHLAIMIELIFILSLINNLECVS